MSSAILYVAIVVIWACVLIPRWLHRGQASEAAGEFSDDSSDPAPADSPAGEEPVSQAAPVTASGAASPAAGAPAAGDSGPRRIPRNRAESRRKMLAARRRLLLTLLALQVGAIALSVTGLAAPWVLVPPTIMLGVYLLLLREAAHADAERRAREAEASAARARTRPAARAAQARRPAPPAPAVPPPPAEEDYSDLGGGRDYAPGLAGKYEPSGAGSDDDVIDFARYKRAAGE